MSSKESQNTKQKLESNKDSFKNLESTVDDLQAEMNKKIIREINALDAQQQHDTKRLSARKKALALKGKFTQSYTQDDRSPQEIPVDGELKAGTMVFMKNCYTCHSLEAIDPKPRKGPSLGLIYNHRAGSNTSFQSYTNKMLKSTFFWSPKNLYRFMADPSSLVPNTTCWLYKHPLHSEQDRADLITMFREFTIEMMFNIRMKQIQRVGYTAYQSTLHTADEQRKRGEERDKREQNMDKKI